MHLRIRNFFLVVFLGGFLFFPFGIFAQSEIDFPNTAEEAEERLRGEQSRTAALRAELERRRAEKLTQLALKPVDNVDKTLLLRLSLKGKAFGVGSGTVIGCSPSEAKPDKYVCFILLSSHFFEDQKNQAPIDPYHFSIKGNGLFRGGKPLVANIPITIMGIDRRNDIAVGLMYTDVPLPAAPLPPRNYVPKIGTPITSVGCSSGVPRSYGASDTCIIAIGPSGVIQTNYPPELGDSGGGIYDSSVGCVIGACTSFSYLPDGTPLNIGNYAPAKYAYGIIDMLKARNKYTNIGFDKNGYLKVIPTSSRTMLR